MTTSNIKNISKSVRQRLLNHAKSQGDNFNTLMVQYVLCGFEHKLQMREHKLQIEGA